MSDAPKDNPLLAPPSELPRFDVIRPEHVEPALRLLLAHLTEGIAELERRAEASWAGRNSKGLRSAYEAMQPEVVETFTRLGQSRPLYEAAKALRDGPDWARLDAGQRRIVEKMILDAELGGVGLEGEARERFNAIQQELAELSTTFSNHVLDATREFALVLRTREEVEGLPESLLALAAQSAREAGEADATPEAGPWRITLDQPSFGPFMQHARRRDLRETLYRAHVARASSGEHDNTAIIDAILELRREKAALLGYEDYAALSLARKMAGSVAEVLDLLEELREKAWPAAKRDFDELVEHARAHGTDAIAHWDIAYWAERLREARFAFTDEQLRPYFPLPKVLDGLFALARRLFGVRIESADGEAPTWHPDVRFFRIFDEDGTPRAAFYLDPYSRPAEKRGGAWMDECLVRSRLFAPDGHAVRLPVAHLVCNGTPPVDGRPSLMTFRDVETLFHEFGHGLQHMLTAVDHEGAAGINGIEWDAVELPSQFMENWCYHEPTLMGLSGHWQTGEPLPRELFEKIVAARTFRSGSDTDRKSVV